MTTGTFATPEVEIPRDRWGRPMIKQADGGQVAYTRASTLGKALEEQSALAAWKQRMTLIGVTLAPHLAMSAAAHREPTAANKSKLNDLCEQAMQAAQANARAEIGTALHKLLETVDAGRDPGPFPAEYHADVEAYRAATAGFRWLGAEQFVVCDSLQAAGTFDRTRIVPPKGRSKAKPTVRVVDIKTGSGVDYAWLSIAVQLAVYAHGERYDPVTGERTPLGLDPATGEVHDVDLRVAEVIWLPAGEGRAQVIEVDIASGWTAAGLATGVRKLRKEARSWAKAAAQVEATLEQLVESAPTVEALTALWQTHGAAFTDDLTQLATARYALLAQGAVA